MGREPFRHHQSRASSAERNRRSGRVRFASPLPPPACSFARSAPRRGVMAATHDGLSSLRPPPDPNHTRPRRGAIRFEMHRQQRIPRQAHSVVDPAAAAAAAAGVMRGKGRAGAYGLPASGLGWQRRGRRQPTLTHPTPINRSTHDARTPSPQHTAHGHSHRAPHSSFLFVGRPRARACSKSQATTTQAAAAGSSGSTRRRRPPTPSTHPPWRRRPPAAATTAGGA